MKAAREGLDQIMESLSVMDRKTLEKAGIYKEKLSIYRKRGNLPNSVNLIACLVLFRIPLRVLDPDTGDTWVLQFENEESQMTLPLHWEKPREDRNKLKIP